jgi:hypothetical protein
MPGLIMADIIVKQEVWDDLVEKLERLQYTHATMLQQVYFRKEQRANPFADKDWLVNIVKTGPCLIQYRGGDLKFTFTDDAGGVGPTGSKP